ncbi:MAG: glycosyltransferase [Rhodoluna sp.]
MSLTVVTVVLSNDQPIFLENCLSAIEKQSFRSERVLVVDTSTDISTEKVLDEFISRSSKHAVIKFQDKADFAELVALGFKQVLSGIENLENFALWLVHDDAVPEVHALAELVRTLELSPIVGIASPKQLAIDNPKLIVQQGLTMTKSLKPFSIVNDELDQKQHDSMSDVLAVSSNAMLIRANLWVELSGFSLSAPELAQDVELGIRTHQLGYRVVVVPTARVRHGELSLNGRRSKKWLGGSTKYALAKATNHLRLSQWPMLLAFTYWLTLPISSLFQIFYLLLLKRPDRIWPNLKANLWAILTFRARTRDRHGLSLKALRALFANSAQVKARRRLALEIVEQRENLASFDSQKDRLQISFAAGGGLWLMLALTVLSFAYFPLGNAVLGGYALPLSDHWLDLFANTASSYQHIGLSLAAPSDPFNWVLLGIGSLTFWAPNIALSWLLLLAKPLAFFGTWRLLSAFTSRNSLRIVFALVYALWPSFTSAQAQGNIPAVIFSITLPWLIFALLRVAKFGNSPSVRSSAQNWSWLAASGLLFAVCYASSPSSVFGLIGIFLTFSWLMGKRALLGLVVLIPTAIISGPYLLFGLFQNRNPLALLVDPTLAIPNQQPVLLESLAGDEPFAWFALGVIAVATVSLVSRAKGMAVGWLIVLFGVVNLWFISSISFPGGGLGSISFPKEGEVYLAPSAAVSLITVTVAVLCVIWLDSLTRPGFRKILLTAFLSLGVLPLAVSSAITPTEVKYGEARNLPAIFTAEAKAGSQLRLLIITGNSEQSFRAEIVQSSGLRLDSISSAYRMNDVNLSSEDPRKAGLANLVANLVSANEQDIKSAIKSSGIGFVLVPESSSNGDIQVALNSAPELDQVGKTEFGQLWRVKQPGEINTDESLTYWSLTKAIQLAVLLGFILLALPTSRGRKQRISNSFTEGESE